MADLVTTARTQLFPNLADIPGPELALLITTASAIVESHCNREFTSRAYDEKHDGDGTTVLMVSAYPVSALDTVGLIDGNNEETEYANTYFRFKSNGIIEWVPQHGMRFPVGFQNVHAEYTAGWTTIPEQVQQAVCHVMQFLWSTQKLDFNVREARGLRGHS
jgi:hypothetical protein